MIQLIVGNKGSGKTKQLISAVNAAVAASNGNVICLEKGLKLTYDLSYNARLVDVDEYSVSGYEQLYGFIVGLLAGNYDITHIFVDSTLKIAGKDFVAFEAMLSRLTALPVMEHVQELIFTVSCDADELPDALKKYIV